MRFVVAFETSNHFEYLDAVVSCNNADTPPTIPTILASWSDSCIIICHDALMKRRNQVCKNKREKVI